MRRLATLACVLAVLSGCVVVKTAPEPDSIPSTRSSSPRLAAVNAERRAHGLSPVYLHDRTAVAARRHATDMVRNDFFAHRGSDGTSAGQRLSAAGCRGWRAENIARGDILNLPSVVDAWLKSPDHRSNILHPQMRWASIENVGDAWVMTLASSC